MMSVDVSCPLLFVILVTFIVAVATIVVVSIVVVSVIVISIIIIIIFMFIIMFYRVTHMHSADYAVARRLSVRPSVCPSVSLSVTRRYSVKTVEHIR